VIQFAVQQSRLTPKAEKVLTGGIGLLAQHDLDEFDEIVRSLVRVVVVLRGLMVLIVLQVDKIVNTACHETNKDTIPRLINDFRDRRLEYFKSLHGAVYKKASSGSFSGPS
jgi:hypothetical protein